MRNSLPDPVATAVRVELARRNMRVNELATATGIKPALLSHRLTGRTAFKPVEIAKVTDAFGMTYNELLADVTGPAAENSGQHSVSPALSSDAGSRERLDRPAASDADPS